MAGAAAPAIRHSDHLSPFTDHRLERQVVVLALQRPREVLEVVAARGGLGLLGCRGPAETLRHALPTPVTTAPAPPAPPRRAEHDELTHVDLGRVARLAVLVLPLTVLDSPFHVDLVALFDVALHDV